MAKSEVNGHGLHDVTAVRVGMCDGRISITSNTTLNGWWHRLMLTPEETRVLIARLQSRLAMHESACKEMAVE